MPIKIEQRDGQKYAKVADLKNWKDNPKSFSKVEFDRLIEQIKLGEHSTMLIDTDVGKGAGGLQSFDRHKMALTEVEVLREIYPALEVRKVEGKTWGIEPVLKGDFFGVKKI